MLILSLYYHHPASTNLVCEHVMFENQPPPRPAVLLVVGVVGVGVRHSHDLPLISLEITVRTLISTAVIKQSYKVTLYYHQNQVEIISSGEEKVHNSIVHHNYKNMTTANFGCSL